MPDLACDACDHFLLLLIVVQVEKARAPPKHKPFLTDSNPKQKDDLAVREVNRGFQMVQEPG